MLLALLASCEGDSRARSTCHLRPAATVARASALRFDAAALTTRGDAVLLAWSEPAGLFTRRLDARGKPTHGAKRIAERCAGGLAVALHRARVHVACSRPHEDDGGELVLLTLGDAGEALTTQKLAEPGADARGVSLVSAGDALLVGFHDGHRGAYAARLLIVEGDTVSAVALSDPAFAASAPTLETQGGTWIAAWSETRFEVQGTSHTRLMAKSHGKPARVLGETSVSDPAPSLAWDARSPFVVFRDRRGSSTRAELFAVRLTEGLATRDEPELVGRANGEGGPSALSCGSLRVALLPRDYASERYVAVHALDPTLKNLDAGHQYYANSRDFVSAAGTCVGDELLALAMERGSPGSASISIASMRFHCGS